MNTFDSQEELYFSWYVTQLQDNNIITEWYYHPKPFLLSNSVFHRYDIQMKTKVKAGQSTLLQDHSYQADFLIYWNPNFEGRMFTSLNNHLSLNYPFIANFKNNKHFSVIDVKGMFAGPHNNSAITFPLDQKWVYQKYGLFVQKIIPDKLFKATFVPYRYELTDKSMKERKINYKKRTLLEFLVLSVDQKIIPSLTFKTDSHEE